MRKTVGLRRAIAASVAAHVAAAVVLVAVLRPPAPPRPSPGAIDTRIQEVSLRLDPDEAAPVTPPTPVEPPEAPTEPPVSPPAEPLPTSRPPLATPTPAPLSADVLAVIRRPRAAAAAAPDPDVKPAGAASPSARPIHGAMRPKQAVVYVLDCSGSMGEFGKLDAARTALLATLCRQPESVRFQVLVYNSTTRAVLSGGLAAATPANVAAAEAGLARVEPAGRSNHADAVRTAAGLRPDVVLVLTDAEVPPVRIGGKPAPVWVARVTPQGVEAPKEVR